MSAAWVAVGQVPEYTTLITEWVKEVARTPVLVKLTPNISDMAAAPLYNLGAPWFGRATLPRPGDKLRSAYASLICIANDEIAVFRALLRELYNLARRNRVQQPTQRRSGVYCQRWKPQKEIPDKGTASVETKKHRGSSLCIHGATNVTGGILLGMSWDIGSAMPAYTHLPK